MVIVSINMPRKSPMYAASSSSSPQLGGFMNESSELGFSTSSMPQGAKLHLNHSTNNGETYLRIIEEPVDKFRYRYKSEKGSHGGLTGINNSRNKKTYPTVKLENYYSPEPAFIKVSLFTNDDVPQEHVHRILSRNFKEDEFKIKLEENRTAEFKNISIQFATREECQKILLGRNRGSLNSEEQKKLKKQLKEMDLNCVRLGFQAFNSDSKDPLCPIIFSQPIYNLKSAQAGDLKICRISECTGSCTGNDEVYLLCDKVKKEDIKVRFFETNNDVTIWESFGTFSPSDVHHQVAIVFRTPPYHTTNLLQSVEVNLSLYRTSDESQSKPLKFTYKPSDTDEMILSRKRKRVNDKHEGVPSNLTFDYSSTQNEQEEAAISSNLVQLIGSSTASRSSPSTHTEATIGTENRESSLLDILHLTDMTDLSHYFPDNMELNDLMRDFDLSYQGEMSEPDVSDHENQSATLETDSVSEIRNQSAMFYPKSISTIQNQPASLKSSMKRVCKEKKSYVLADTSMPVSISLENLLYLPSNLPTVMQAVREKIQTYFNGDNVMQTAREKIQTYCNRDKQDFCKELLQHLHHLILTHNTDRNNLLHIVVSNQGSNEDFIKSLLHIFPEYLDAVNQPNITKQTPVHFATLWNKPPELGLLLSNNGDPNRRDNRGNSCVHIAAQNDFLMCLGEMIKSRKLSSESLNYLNDEGLSPLHIAVMQKFVNFVKILIRAGAAINKPESKAGRSALHLAVESNSNELVEYLLAQPEIHVDEQDYSGNTALDLACANGCVNIIKALMKANADPCISTYDLNSDSTIERIAVDIANGNEKVLKILEATEEDNEYVSEESAFEEEINIKKNSNKLLDTVCEEKLCCLLDPPNEAWKNLGLYLGWEEEDLNCIAALSKSPTKRLLAKFQKDGGDVKTLQIILVYSGLQEALAIIQNSNRDFDSLVNQYEKLKL